MVSSDQERCVATQAVWNGESTATSHFSVRSCSLLEPAVCPNLSPRCSSSELTVKSFESHHRVRLATGIRDACVSPCLPCTLTGLICDVVLDG